MSGLFSDAWDYIKMTAWDQPTDILKDVGKGDIGGAFDDWKHTFGDNELAESGMFHDVGIDGWVGDHPEETAGAVVGTIFGGMYAAGAYGATAAAGSGAATTAGAGTTAASGAAPISEAVGTLTPAGEAMGGQAAVDANMAAGASSESAFANFFHVSPTTGGGFSSAWNQIGSYYSPNGQASKDQAARQKREQEFMNSDDSSGSFLPKIKAGSLPDQDQMLQSHIQQPQLSGGPFTGALNNIQQPFK